MPASLPARTSRADDTYARSRGLLPGTRHECREHETHRPLRGNRNAVPQAHDRVQDRPRRVRKGFPAITESGERTPRPRPRKRARSLSYCSVSTTSPSGAARWASQTEARPPNAGAASPARSRARVRTPSPRQVREGGVGLVRGLSRQHDLGIGREIDFTVPVFEIGHSQSTQLGVVLGDTTISRVIERDGSRCMILTRSSE